MSEKRRRMVPMVEKEQREESLLETLRPALGIEFSFDIEKGIIKSKAWPTGVTKEYPVPELQWEISENGIIYRGRKADLPAFLPCFKIPVRAAWFDVLFTTSKEKSHTIYRDDAFAVATGYIVYSRAEAYLDGQWLSALQKGFFAAQVEWAELPRVGTDRSLATLKLSILKPNANHTALEKQQMLGTTQGRFVAFLKSGDLKDIESRG